MGRGRLESRGEELSEGKRVDRQEEIVAQG